MPTHKRPHNPALPLSLFGIVFLLVCSPHDTPAQTIELTTDDISAITASSYLDNQRMWHFQNIMDGKTDTPWVPHNKGNAEGEWIQIRFKKPYTISRIAIANGFAAHQKSFLKNNRVKAATLFFADESKQSISLADNLSFQSFVINDIKSTYIKLQIESIYKGYQYPDTCLSEIKIFVQPD